MAYDKSNLELDSSIGASSIPARVNIGAYVSRRLWGLRDCLDRLIYRNKLFPISICRLHHEFDLFRKLACKV